MNIPGYGIPKEQMIDAVRKSGIDLARLVADVQANTDAIGGLIKRNLTIAEAIGCRARPDSWSAPTRSRKPSITTASSASLRMRVPSNANDSAAVLRKKKRQ